MFHSLHKIVDFNSQGAVGTLWVYLEPVTFLENKFSVGESRYSKISRGQDFN